MSSNQHKVYWILDLRCHVIGISNQLDVYTYCHYKYMINVSHSIYLHSNFNVVLSKHELNIYEQGTT